jgi:hypothetical protein
VLFYDRRGDPQNRKQIVVLARSTDDGASFTNYAWTSEPFDASGVFFGDYTGLAAFDGHVYGVWMEKPPQQTETASDSEDKDAQEKDAKPKAPKPSGTVVKVGTADFTKRAVGQLQVAKAPGAQSE